jgi:predicted ATPase
MPWSNRHFEADMMARLRRGEHLVLYGPRGSGKSALIARLHARFARAGIPCGLSSATAHLDDITRALARAYPRVDTDDIPRRKARAHLRTAADANEGILLLDHVTDVSTAMIGFLRRLRGGITGVLLAVDVEKEQDGQRLRHRHLGTLALPMPPVPTGSLRKLFRQCTADRRLPRISATLERQIMRSARGRPGWIVQCARLIAEERYWRDEILQASLLCVDTEILLRQGQLKLLPQPQRADPVGADAP